MSFTHILLDKLMLTESLKNEKLRKPVSIVRALVVDNAWQICNNDSVFNSEKEVRMALSAHLQELSEKHRQLERRIEEEALRPGSDDTTIRRLKQEKLKLKDEIVRLAVPTRH